jgi:ABC-type Na+ efflux pump permease subunit
LQFEVRAQAARDLFEENRAMIMTNKLLPVALIAALVGGSVGALVMNRTQSATAETTTAQDTARTATPVSAEQPQANENLTAAGFNTAGEQTAYKTGFADGFAAASEQQTKAVSTTNTRRTPARVVYRNSGSTSSARRVYYDYQPRQRSFWDKHRDKLTVAIGTGAGAAVGGLIGGKKGAAIGALSGAGGSALWTYKLRNRNRSY